MKWFMLLQAVRATNLHNMPGWFKEGTAEFIHGADYRLDVADGSYDNQLQCRFK